MAKLERPEIGWLGELAVDQAPVVGSGGRLIPWIPLVDAHGVDRASSWDSVDAPSFVQVKTSGFADEEGRHRWELRVGSFAAYRQFSVVLALIDPKTNQIGEVFWRLDSTLVRVSPGASTIQRFAPRSTAWMGLRRTTTASLPTATAGKSSGGNTLPASDSARL